MGLSDDLISRKDAETSEGRDFSELPDRPNVDRLPRGHSGLTRLGRELLEDGTILLWQIAKAENLTPVFWTVTLPTHFQDGSPLAASDHLRILANWSEFVKRVFEEVARLYQRKGLPNRFLYVVEPQEDRWRQYGTFAPHIHAVLINRWNPRKRNPYKDKGFKNTGFWEVELTETDQIVERVLNNLLGKDVNCLSACNIQSIAGMRNLFFYLTKLGKVARYISKGSAVLEQVRKSKWVNYLPSAWYGSDKESRQEVRSSVFTIPLGVMSQIDVSRCVLEISETFENLNQRPLFTYPHSVKKVVEDGRELIVCTVFRIRRLEDIADAIVILSNLSELYPP